MKSTTTVAFGLLAGLASAYNHHPRHMHAPYVRRNETAVAAGPSTTLTVAITSVHTITSCAPTITNCPANTGNSTGPVTVTEVIDLTTTVCPVADATSISNSVVGAHSSGLISGTTHVLTTTDNSPAQTPAPSSEAGLTVYPTVTTGDSTLTMTLGPEGSQSVSVTTIHSTFTEIVTLTAVPVPSSGASGSDGSDVTSEEGTTTTTRTTTSTRTVTVPGSTSASTVIGSNSGSGSGSGSGSSSVGAEAECSPVTVTVTEAAPASTVYVTIGDNGSGYPTGVKVPSNAESAATATVTAASPTGTAVNSGSTGDETGEDGDECPPEETSSDVTLIATATVVPYPSGNGTLSTGYPVGTGAPIQKRHPLY